MTYSDVVREFWRLMDSNDFFSVSAVMAPEVVIDWPQTNERIRGVANFARLNADYPSNGRWVFTVHRIVGNSEEAVSDVSFTDGVQFARSIAFFTIREGKIIHILEYWPEPYTPPANRAHLVEKIV